MKKLLFALIIVGIIGATVLGSTRLFKLFQLEGKTALSLKGETVTFPQQGSGTWVAGTPTINSKEDLAEYFLRAKERLKNVDNKTSYLSVVTFSKPLSLAELNELIQNSKLHPLAVKFVSQPEGGGQLKYPVTEQDLEELSQQEIFIKSEFRKAKQQDPTTITPKDFKLFNGFVSVTTKDTGQTLKEIDNPIILLIDVGPIEYRSESFATFPTKDVYWEWKQYGK